MRLQRLRVVDLRVGGHFGAALFARPIFGGGDELRADAAAAMGFCDVPSFDVADRTSPIAAVGCRSQADLDESDYFRVRVLSNKVNERHDSGRFPRQDW